MTKRFSLLILLAVVLGLGLRCVDLDLRPMHTDEAVKAEMFRELWEGGVYTYDPSEHHGPALAYSTLLWGKLTHAGDFARWSEDRFRGLTVLFGIGLILLLPLVSDGLGRNGTLAAAFLTAVSPIMVYYSRDYIHEPLLVFFTFLALAAGWRYSQERKIQWIILAGAAIGLMQATKETFVFNLAAAIGAWLLNKAIAPRSLKARTTKPIPRAHLIAAGGAWLVVWVLLFSSFFSHAAGPLDALRTYLFWGERAQGASVHVHEWGFYWQRLLFFHTQGGPVWSEGLILVLAAVAGVVVFTRRELPGVNIALVRFILSYTAILAVIYMIIPYKTPWCALGFWHGAILLAGVGAASLLSQLPSFRLKMVAGIILLAGACHLAFQAWQSDVNYVADQRNPWTYAQTSPDLLNLVSEIKGIAQVSPEGNGVRINVIAPANDYYPLPWYLREFGQAFYLDEVPGYSIFAAGDIDPEELASELRHKSNPMSAFLMDSIFSKYPEISCAPPFSVGDIKDVSAFAAKLTDKADAVSSFISKQLDEKANNSLSINRSSGHPPPDLEGLLIQNLNTIVEHWLIYDSDRFESVSLRSQTSDMLTNEVGTNEMLTNETLASEMLRSEMRTNEMLANHPQGLDVIRLNRMLLEDAYPAELKRADVETILETNLNHLLVGPSIYESNHFQNIPLRSTTWLLHSENPDSQDLIRLNRMLLEDAFTNGISKNLPPEEIYPAISVISTQLESDVDTNKAGIMPRIFELRPGTFLELYVKSNLWLSYLQRSAR